MVSQLNFYGRREILTDERVITKENVLDILKKAVGVHTQNAHDIDFLHGYYVGRHNILDRIKEVRPEINNKIVENHAAEIVNFKTGFTFGEPVQYVYRGESPAGDNDGDDNGIAYLNRLMDDSNKPAQDSEIGQWFYECGIAYRMALLENNTLNLYVCDPRNTFVVYSNDFKREPLLACTFSRGENKDVYSVYSKNHFWVVENLNNIVEEREFATGIPIFEYRHNPTRQGAFETVLPLIDALNTTVSNREDGIEQIVQSLIWFNNCEIDADQIDKLRANGIIQTKSSQGMPANIQMLSAVLDQQQVQTLVDYTYQTMLTIAAVPDRKASAGGNTGQALIVGQGWVMAESAAKSMEKQFIAAERRFLAYALRALRSDIQLQSLSLGDIEIKFTRNKTDNLLTKTQGLQNQLEAGIHPRIAIANCGLYSDPEQVFIDSEEYMQKWIQTGEQDKAAANVADMDGELRAILDKIGGEDNGELSER